MVIAYRKKQGERTTTVTIIHAKKPFGMSSNDSLKLEALRVAQAELSSGDTTGKVFMQASPGAAMFLADRKVAKEKVAAEIRQIVLGEVGGGDGKTKLR